MLERLDSNIDLYADEHVKSEAERRCFAYEAAGLFDVELDADARLQLAARLDAFLLPHWNTPLRTAAQHALSAACIREPADPVPAAERLLRFFSTGSTDPVAAGGR